MQGYVLYGKQLRVTIMEKDENRQLYKNCTKYYFFNFITEKSKYKKEWKN